MFVVRGLGLCLVVCSRQRCELLVVQRFRGVVGLRGRLVARFRGFDGERQTFGLGAGFVRRRDRVLVGGWYHVQFILDLGEDVAHGGRWIC